MRVFGQDLIVTVFGAATSLATAVLLFFIENTWGVSIYTWTFWFVIPAGAGFAGFAAASGYYAGARLFGHRPTPLILVNMVAVSVGTFFLIYYLGYFFLEINGKRVSEVVPFTTYLNFLLQHESLEFWVRGAKKGSTGELGAWGYAHAVLQIVGFALGGAGVFGYLSSLPHCQKCSRYLSGVGKQVRFSGDADAYASMVREVAGTFQGGRPQDGIDYLAGFGDRKYSKGHHLKSTLELRKCRKCGVQWIGFSAHKQSGTLATDWKEMSNLGFGQFHEGPLTLQD